MPHDVVHLKIVKKIKVEERAMSNVKGGAAGLQWDRGRHAGIQAGGQAGRQAGRQAGKRVHRSDFTKR